MASKQQQSLQYDSFMRFQNSSASKEKIIRLK